MNTGSEMRTLNAWNVHTDEILEVGPFDAITIGGDGRATAAGAEVAHFDVSLDRWLFGDFEATDFTFGSRVSAILPSGGAQDFGPFEILQITYETVRVDPHGDRALAALHPGKRVWESCAVGTERQAFSALILLADGADA